MSVPSDSNFTKRVASKWLLGKGRMEGRGRAWKDGKKDIVRERNVPDGVVGKRYGKYPKTAAKSSPMDDFIVRTNQIEGYDVKPEDVRDARDAVAEGYPISYATQDKHILAQHKMLGALKEVSKLDAKAVQDIHRAQGSDVLDGGAPGHWRSGGSRSSGGTQYVEPDQIPAAMKWWEQQKFDSPFQKIAVLMQIHPFEDGNGRMGRMGLLKLNDMDVEKTLKEVGPDYLKELRQSIQDSGLDLESPPWKNAQEAPAKKRADWDAFLKRFYEGGKALVPNPNTDQGAKKEITVHHLLKTWPASTQAVKIRRHYQEVSKDDAGEHPKEAVPKLAKATGDKKWGGEHVGIFIPLPKGLAKKFPALKGEDSSPSHVTFIYLGTIKNQEDQETLLKALKKIKGDWPEITATLDGLGHFDHADKDRRVAHVKVKFDKDMAAMRSRIKQELIDAGVLVEDSYPDYKAHVTLAYMEGSDSPDYDGDVPEGNWKFKEMELWGLPEVHKIKLGSSHYKIHDKWLRQRFVAAVTRLYQRPGVKTAGWWALDGSKPPVDKGPLMNAVPGCDPADATQYLGDDPFDHTGAYLDQIDLIYRTVWGRPAAPDELRETFMSCYRPVEEGCTKLNEWFDDFICWLGIPATDITWSLDIWDQISWFFLQVRNQKFFQRNPGVLLGPPSPPNPDVWKTFDIVKADLLRLNDLEYASDSVLGRQFYDSVVSKLKALRQYWLDNMFFQTSSSSDQAAVARVAERWMAA